jgi:hypothetical protein
MIASSACSAESRLVADEARRGVSLAPSSSFGTTAEGSAHAMSTNATIEPSAAPRVSAPDAAVRERVGDLVGLATAPLAAAVASARHARVFHADGILLSARVDPVVRSVVPMVSERLRGQAIVRFSSALWRHEREWPDALGCAIRFRSTARASAEPEERDQDLLFATIRSPFTLPIAPFGTHVHDYLANTYFATSPFDVAGVGRVKWRLVPEHAATGPGTRTERLRDAITHGEARLRLELRRTFHPAWLPVSLITLIRPIAIDQEELRFSPFRTGRGITPRGFVHALRRVVYPASQGARPHSRH